MFRLTCSYTVLIAPYSLSWGNPLKFTLRGLELRTAGVEESIVIKETGVIASLRKLKSNETTDPDGLKVCLLKACAPQL